VVKVVAAANHITLVIEGLPEDAGRVRFNAFMTQLQRLSATLAKLDREANDGKSVTHFEIAELSYNSPVRVVLEAKAPAKFSSAPSILFDGLSRFVGALDGDDDLSGIDADLLDDFLGLVKPVGKNIRSCALLFNDVGYELTGRIANKIENALKVEDECDGCVDGMLEQINIHHGANIFHIYPLVGPKKITCHFPASLYDDAVAAVGRKVEVSGLLKYRSGASFPHLIGVRSIDAFPNDSELPDWEDLLGRAPAATGDLSSEAFVRELRDAWG
jgi:hypothetical protein